MTRYRTAAAIGIVGSDGRGDVDFKDCPAGVKSQAMESSSARLDAWAAGFQMLKSNPLFGVGFGAFIDFNG